MMNKKYLFMLIMFISLWGCETATSPLSSDSFGKPHDLFPHLKDNGYLIGYSKDALELAKKRLMENDPITKQALDEVLKRADEALNDKLYTITDYDYPPRPSKHLYSSVALYYHPRKDGTNSWCGTWSNLPWERKDGIPNEEARGLGTVTEGMGKINGGVADMALAYYFTKDIRYAEKAAAQIKMGFLNKDTYVIPDGTWSQAAPGTFSAWPSAFLVFLAPDGTQFTSNYVYHEQPDDPEKFVKENNLKAAYKGTRGGLIDMKGFMEPIDAAMLIIDSGALTKADYRQLIDWYGAPKGTTSYDGMYEMGGMLTWFRDPDNLIEDNSDNAANAHNQSIWLEVDYLVFSLFVGHVYPGELDNIRNLRIPRLKAKMTRCFAPDGSIPAELGRPNSHHYCTYSLHAWGEAAHTAKVFGDNSIWGNYDDGRTLKNGIRLMLYYAQHPDSWPYSDILGVAERRSRSLSFLAPAQYVPGYSDMEGLLETTSSILKENPLNLYNLIWPRVID